MRGRFNNLYEPTGSAFSVRLSREQTQVRGVAAARDSSPVAAAPSSCQCADVCRALVA